MMQAFWQGESTNPLLSVHEVLKDNGVKEDKIRFLQYLFAGAFIYLRCYFVPPTLNYIMGSKSSLVLKIPLALVCKSLCLF